MSDDEFEDEPSSTRKTSTRTFSTRTSYDEVAVDDDLDDDLDDELDRRRRGSRRGRRSLPETVEEDEEDDVVDLDEELHPDDVEEALDVVLRERTVAAGLEEDEEDDDEPDEPGEGGTKIVPRRENEFLCRSCFLVLPRHQLADEKRMICRDCA